MNVLLAHTMTAPHVQQPARALHEAGMLAGYVTSIHRDPHSRLQRLAERLSRAVGFDLESQLRKRTVTEVPLDRVTSHPAGEWLRLLVGRLDRSGVWTDRVWDYTEKRFDRLVARHLTPDMGAVYGWEYSMNQSFQRAKELGLRCIYDVSAAEPSFARSMLEREVKRFPELQSRYFHHTAELAEQRNRYRRAEWEAADMVIANSKFTRDSYAGDGRNLSKVTVVPLGAPAPVESTLAHSGGSHGQGPLRVLFAGKFGILKGAHTLIEAWTTGRLAERATLDVYGARALPDHLISPPPTGITFHGPVPRPELMTKYQEADLLVFPTLCDGFGMVATEAWSRGLPVLTTRNAGAADLLCPGENGLLVDAGDAVDLARALNWAVDHRAELKPMREAAWATARDWQWSDYRAAIVQAVRTLGEPPASPPQATTGDA